MSDAYAMAGNQLTHASHEEYPVGLHLYNVSTKLLLRAAALASGSPPPDSSTCFDLWCAIEAEARHSIADAAQDYLKAFEESMVDIERLLVEVETSLALPHLTAEETLELEALPEGVVSKLVEAYSTLSGIKLSPSDPDTIDSAVQAFSTLGKSNHAPCHREAFDAAVRRYVVGAVRPTLRSS